MSAQGQANGDAKDKSKNGKGGRTIKEDKDDLVSRLTRGLKSRPYLECPIVSMARLRARLAIISNGSASTPSRLISPSGHAYRLPPRLPRRRTLPRTSRLLILPSTTLLATPRSTYRASGIGQTDRS
jgi:hypothetical protein